MKMRMMLMALAGMAIVATPLPAQMTGSRSPHAGYLYPAGGQVGTTVEVWVGGQNLRGAKRVFITGEGVEGRVVEWAKPVNNKDLSEVRSQLGGILKKQRGNSKLDPSLTVGQLAEGMMMPLNLPDHPLLRGISSMTVEELQYWTDLYVVSKKRQQNAQIGETAVLELTIAADAAPGMREVRVEGAAGLSNPLQFEISVLPGQNEREPNDEKAADGKVPVLPIVFNGQIVPGDVDHLRFRAQQGRPVVIDVDARRLIPYLADAVPGWFQPEISLLDAYGDEIAFADDYRFDPDPVLYFEPPRDGEYELVIHDALYRGREDFVYRASIGELPFITAISPLGVQEGAATVADIAGWNLPSKVLPLDASAGGGNVRMAQALSPLGPSNPVYYQVDAMPELREIEPNNAVHVAQALTLPVWINGAIESAADMDYFAFDGQADLPVVVEVYARRLSSPLDALLRLTDESGDVIAWNDDCPEQETGLLTHGADPYLRTKLPHDGRYFVQISDAQNHGGPESAYRVRISAPQPDFALRITPSSINVPVGRFAPLCVHALRKDGFDGEIRIDLAGAPEGFSLQGACIPAGRDSIRFTLAAPRIPIPEPVAVSFSGTARIGDVDVTHRAVPADDLEQAFIYRHLVPAKTMLVDVIGGKKSGAPISRLGDGEVHIAKGGTSHVEFSLPKSAKPPTLEIELDEPPKGVHIGPASINPGVLAFNIQLDADALETGYAGNLIVTAYSVPPQEPAPAPAAGASAAPPQPPAKKSQKPQRTLLGVLPAIPIVID